ncbi:MAG: carbohydrate ABC transporter permease [Chloroflexi bacterium]|nr:carbohydrate ABC transporter permease [Chloroflexota bacterium]
MYRSETLRRHVWRGLERIGLYLLLAIGAVISLFPFYWMVATSLKPSYEIFQWPPTMVPTRVTLDAYRYVWATMDVPRSVFNSVVVAVSQVSLNIFFSSLVAYALAKLVFPGKRYLFLIVLALMILPQQIVMIPLFLQIHRLGLLDSYGGLVLPGAVTSFTIFLLRQAFLSLPDEYVDAAIIDGATHFHILFRIAYPIVKPLIFTAALINFNWNWSSFLWPFIVVVHDEMATLPVALARYRTFEVQRWDAIMAASTVVALPIVLVYLVIQRQFVESLTMTGLKG